VSFGEIVVLALIALVVVGPKDLPKVLRTAGKLIGQAKRAIADVRKETGLEEVLRGDFQDLERLADHIEHLDAEVQDGLDGRPKLPHKPKHLDYVALRADEYPRVGADANGLLPDDASVYPDLPAFLTGAGEKLAATASQPVADEEIPT
jgi:sec-independent protein translocase protein TatB